jgi:ATP-dependent Lon protease
MPVFRSEQVLAGTGVITGLAWTSMGGATCRSRRRASTRSTAASSSPASWVM